MKPYHFYGWEAAHVRDSLGLTPCDYYDPEFVGWFTLNTAQSQKKVQQTIDFPCFSLAFSSFSLYDISMNFAPILYRNSEEKPSGK